MARDEPEYQGRHSAPETPVVVQVGRKISKFWKAIGGFIGASGTTCLAQITAVDWDNPTRTAVVSLGSGIVGALITYFMPANKTSD